MSNGLLLSVEEFNELPTKAKWTCLYENQVRQIELASGQKKENSKIKLHQRVQYFAMSGLLASVVFTFKFFVGRL